MYHDEFHRDDNLCTVVSLSIDDYNLSNNRCNFNGLECLVAYDSYRTINPQAPLRIGAKANKVRVGQDSIASYGM